MLLIHHVFATGVECDSISGSATYGRVQVIDLSSKSLSGTIPSSIGNFEWMTSMSLRGNKIAGSIPSAISGLTSLQLLHLDSNSLEGTIPSAISGLTSLQGLYLNSNSLVGTIPSAISTLKSLYYLSLHSNSLVGTIPSTISALTSLGSLSISNNYLTMGTATSVSISTFSPTSLSGTINLNENCLVFDTRSPLPYRHVTATHCRSPGNHGRYYHNVLYFFITLCSEGHGKIHARTVKCLTYCQHILHLLILYASKYCGLCPR